MGTVSLNNVAYMEHAMLVKRFQNGEPEAFNEIVDRWHKHIHNLAYRFTRNYDDACDISQEVFIKVFRSLSSLRNSSAFDMWLRRITVNTCMDYLRQQPDEQLMDDLSHLGDRVENSTGLPSKPVETDELGNVIFRAVNQLPRRQRRVFMLRHYDGLSLKEISDKLNCSLGTVKAHLFRATHRLRKLLLPYYRVTFS